MTAYERRCRLLLRGFPAAYRTEREEEIVTTLLDTARPLQRWPSTRTVVDLLAAAMRTRGRLSTAGRLDQLWFESLRLVAIIGLCMQAAFSVAVATHYWRDGMLFYAPTNAASPFAHAAVAGAWTVALVLVVVGRLRLAVFPAVVATWGLLLFEASLTNSNDQATSIVALGFASLGLVSFVALAVTAMRRPSTPTSRSWLWLLAFLILGLAMSWVDDGVRAVPGAGLGSSFPPGGSLVTLVGTLWIGAALALAAASRFDPRFGITMAIVSVPVLIYRLGVVLGRFVLDRPSELPMRPLPWDDIVVLAALAVLVVLLILSSINTMRRMRQL